MKYPYEEAYFPWTHPERIVSADGVSNVALDIIDTDDVIEVFLVNSQFSAFVAVTNVYRKSVKIELGPLLVVGQNKIYIKARNYDGGSGNKIACVFDLIFFNALGAPVASVSEAIRGNLKPSGHFYHSAISFNV
jgi:hypothetical protein